MLAVVFNTFFVIFGKAALNASEDADADADDD